jgi:ubiquinone/menaquinone biosynthesis C-methylase UbiE
MQRADDQYALGHDEQELIRLDRQADALAVVTRALLRESGLMPGTTVLDLGTGTGRVALLLAELVGPSGRVVGLDRSAEALAHARRQPVGIGSAPVDFLEADVSAPLPVTADSAVCRLVLAYQHDPVATLQTWMASLRSGGRVVALEFDFSGARALPDVPLVAQVLRWIDEGFGVSGQQQRLGPRLPELFRQAGLRDVGSLGGQLYLDAGDPAAPALPAGVVASLLPAIVRAGIATAEDIGIDILEQRIAGELRRSGAVFCPPTLVACWGRVP